MKTKILILLCGGLGWLAPPAIGQSVAPTVLATGGGAASDDQVQVAWTLGEPIIRTAGTVTQGFHSTEMQVLSGTTSMTADGLVQVFPNPAGRALTLRFQGGALHTAVQATVCNALAQQQLILAIPAEAANYELDCTLLTPGMYWLTLRRNDRSILSTVRFVKN